MIENIILSAMLTITPIKEYNITQYTNQIQNQQKTEQTTTEYRRPNKIKELREQINTEKKKEIADIEMIVKEQAKIEKEQENKLELLIMSKYVIGCGYAENKNWDEAIKEYKETIDIITENQIKDHFLELAVRIDLGTTYCNINKNKEALIEFEKAYKINSKHPLIKNNLAYALALNNKDINKAERLIEEAIQEMPEMPYFKTTKAYIHQTKKEYEKALKEAKEAMELFKKHEIEPNEETKKIIRIIEKKIKK